MDHTPPALNLKCIVFTAALASGYWFLPAKNKYVLAGLAYFPYLILAWYDWIYLCKHNFGPTYLANFYSWAKPQSSSQIKIYKNWAPDIKLRVQAVDLVVAVILLSLLPAFIRWKPSNKISTEEEKNQKIFAWVVFGFTIAILAYLRLFK
jgi:hypothetical protein